jgi:hypothetical protein
MDVKKITARYLQAQEEGDDLEKRLKKAEQVLSPRVRLMLRKAFGQRGMPFFLFYVELRRISLGAPVEIDLYMELRRQAKIFFKIKSRVDKRALSPAIRNQVLSGAKIMRKFFKDVEMDRVTSITWKRIAPAFASIIQAVARDKSVYLKMRPATPANMWFSAFQKMRPKEEAFAQLEDDDPEMYVAILAQKRSLAEIDSRNRSIIARKGEMEERTMIRGRAVILGKNPITEEYTVYDRAWGAVPIERTIDENGKGRWSGEFVEKLEERNAERERLYKQTKRPSLTDPEKIRSLSDEEVDNLSGELNFASMTDDKAKSGRLTRILPTKMKYTEITDAEGNTVKQGQQVIVDGRFKGLYLDDLVSANGRMLEGTVYEIHPKSARFRGHPVTREVEKKEPYVTLVEVEEGGKKAHKLMVKLPTDRSPGATKMRNDLYLMASNNQIRKTGTSSTMQYAEGTNRSTYLFDPKDFTAVQAALKGLSLSQGALREVKTYFNDLTRAEEAQAEENLSFYSMEELGGFKRGMELSTTQKRSLAWLDANENKGLLALDTGVGKSLCSVASMQKFLRDGEGDEDNYYLDRKGRKVKTNGKFLFVCPDSLKGNITKEVRKFLSDSVGGDSDEPSPAKVAAQFLQGSFKPVSPMRNVLNRLDVMSYKNWRSANRTGKWKKKPWSAKPYIAIYFDEAQEMAKWKSKAAEHALKLDHPHKICLTASPMEREPMEAWVLSAICKNVPLHSDNPEEQAHARKEMNKFKDRYCEKVGGRVTEVKDDPVLRAELDVWVKRSLFFTDKSDVPEYDLPPLKESTRVVAMAPEVEEIYRLTTKKFAKVMEGMVSLSRDKGLIGYKTDEEGNITHRYKNPKLTTQMVERISKMFSHKFGPLLKMFDSLMNRPQQAMYEIADWLETNQRVTPQGKEEKLWESVQAVINYMRRQGMTPEHLREIAAGVGNPKLDAAVGLMQDKLGQDPGSRCLYFADDPKLILMNALRMSQELPGVHVGALKDAIHFFRNGSEMESYSMRISKSDVDGICTGAQCDILRERMKELGGKVTYSLPFKKGNKRKYPMFPKREKFNQHYPNTEWQQFVFQVIVNPSTKFKTCSLFGPEYAFGHNLQPFNTVVHLDRDSWNSEQMKQRTARAWRQGQENEVEEITLDATYSVPDTAGERDEKEKIYQGTVDEIRKYFQILEGQLFDSVIKEAQGAELGKEWQGMEKKHASFMQVSKDTAALYLDPQVGNSKTPQDAL